MLCLIFARTWRGVGTLKPAPTPETPAVSPLRSPSSGQDHVVQLLDRHLGCFRRCSGGCLPDDLLDRLCQTLGAKPLRMSEPGDTCSDGIDQPGSRALDLRGLGTR
jgi:hypothetical protein